MKKNEKISVIIATKNEEENIGRLLETIQQQKYTNHEVIVVDNYSTDATLEIAKQFKARIYTQGNERSEQRNFGATKARGKYLLFLDADMRLPPTILAECIDSISTKNRALIIPEDVEVSNFFSRLKRLEKRLYWNETSIEAARFFEHSLFVQLKGYNTKLIAGEDWDLSGRAASFTTISRISTPLMHNENSVIRELRHKWYYAKKIHAYIKIHPHLFAKQSGYHRTKLLVKHPQFWLTYPLEMVALSLLKGIEWGMLFFARLL